MTAYNVDYSFKTEQYGNTVVNADDAEQAEMFATEYVLETYPEVSALDLIIDSVKEV